MTLFQRQSSDLFLHRLYRWQQLRGELASINLAAPERTGPALDIWEKRQEGTESAIHEAACLLMTTHAPAPWMVWAKFEVLEAALFDGTGPGTSTWADHRELWMIAAIKSDLAAIGIGKDAD